MNQKAAPPLNEQNARYQPATAVRESLPVAAAADPQMRAVRETVVARTRTNADGRTDAPLIAAADARAGVFELSFHVGDYFRGSGEATADPPFLDVVPIRFAIADPDAHYHVPLVATPWSYSTYRGS